MKRRILYGTLILGAIALTMALWQGDGVRIGRSGGSSDSTGSSPESIAGAHRQNLIPESTSTSDSVQSNDRLSSARSSERQRRTSLEKAVAAQEKLIAEKRAKLSRWILDNGVVHNKSNPPNGKEFDGVIDEQDVKRGNKVGGYVDLKDELELELKNLERMKSKMK